MNIEKTSVKIFNSIEDAIGASLIEKGETLLDGVKMKEPLASDITSFSFNMQKEAKVHSESGNSYLTIDDLYASIRQASEKVEKMIKEHDRIETGLRPD